MTAIFNLPSNSEEQNDEKTDDYRDRLDFDVAEKLPGRALRLWVLGSKHVFYRLASFQPRKVHFCFRQPDGIVKIKSEMCASN